MNKGEGPHFEARAEPSPGPWLLRGAALLPGASFYRKVLGGGGLEIEFDPWTAWLTVIAVM